MLRFISSIADTVKQIFKTWETNISHQLENTIVTDRKDLKKASNITEEILIITDKYTKWFDKEDYRNYNKLKRKFLRLN